MIITCSFYPGNDNKIGYKLKVFDMIFVSYGRNGQVLKNMVYGTVPLILVGCSNMRMYLLFWDLRSVGQNPTGTKPH